MFFGFSGTKGRKEGAFLFFLAIEVQEGKDVILRYVWIGGFQGTQVILIIEDKGGERTRRGRGLRREEELLCGGEGLEGLRRKEPSATKVFPPI